MCHFIFSEFAKIKDEVPNMIMDAHMGRVKEASERGESDSVANSIEKSGIAGTEKVNLFSYTKLLLTHFSFRFLNPNYFSNLNYN